jgi:GNAT superfamily N-acetyltransferase
MVGADIEGTDAPEGVVLGYLTIDDPADFQDGRPDDPIDRRVSTIWIHPAVRGKGLGRQLGIVAKEHRFFESHSLERTEAGTAWARSIGDEPPPATSVPDPVKFDRGGARMYRLLVDAEPDLSGLPMSG